MVVQAVTNQNQRHRSPGEKGGKGSSTRHLQCAFDHLLPFTGFWPALQIGTFHRLLSLRCPEASLSYHLLELELALADTVRRK